VIVMILAATQLPPLLALLTLRSGMWFFVAPSKLVVNLGARIHRELASLGAVSVSEARGD
jgi:hypothetical protein